MQERYLLGALLGAVVWTAAVGCRPQGATAGSAAAGGAVEKAPSTRPDVGAVAGEYYYGDGYGVNCTLRISSGQRFRFEWSGCMGSYLTIRGEVHPRPDYIILLNDDPRPEAGFTFLVLIPVKWGQRRYLVPHRQLTQFCIEVAAGREPRETAWGDFYLREGDQRKKAEGSPQLPDGWRDLFARSAPGPRRIMPVFPHETWR